MEPQDDADIQSAFALFSSVGECGKVKSYMQTMYRSQYVRNTPMGRPGDLHWSEAEGSTSPNWRASIHIDMALERQYGLKELANTLAHEGHHGFYNDSSDTAAGSFAALCVPQ